MAYFPPLTHAGGIALAKQVMSRGTIAKSTNTVIISYEHKHPKSKSIQ